MRPKMQANAANVIVNHPEAIALYLPTWLPTTHGVHASALNHCVCGRPSPIFERNSTEFVPAACHETRLKLISF